jgi:TPR repeat protein
VQKNNAEAKKWFLRAAQLGQIRALTNLSLRLGTVDSLVHLTEAAVRGDAWACVKLATHNTTGYGLTADKEQAKRWYERALKCTPKPPDEDDRRVANEWLSKNTDVVSTWQC